MEAPSVAMVTARMDTTASCKFLSEVPGRFTIKPLESVAKVSCPLVAGTLRAVLHDHAYSDMNFITLCIGL